jgi:hypothetical protein
VPGAVHTGGNEAFAAMQSFAALLHMSWTVHVVPLGSIVA